MRSRKRKLPIFDILLTSLTLILVTAGVSLLFLYKDHKTAAQNNAMKPDEVTSTVDEKDSHFPGVKIITEISNDMAIPFFIQYPQSTYNKFNDKVKKHMKGIKHKHLTNVANQKAVHTDFTNELNISFEAFEHPNNLYSFVLFTNKYVENLGGKSAVQTFHLNKETGEMPSLEAILNDDLQRLETLSSIAQRSIEEDDAANDLTAIEQYTKPIWENYQDFAFTDEALILYFQHQHEDGSIPIVSIPYEEINDLLIDSYQVEIEKTSSTDAAATKPNNPPGEETNQANQTNHPDEPTEEIDAEEEKPLAKQVALTFDDGPDPDVTTRIVQTLEKYDAKATFFMLGSRVEYYPDIANMVQEAGHELANHSWTHPDLTKASPEKISSEIDRTSKVIEDVTGEKPYLFRPPYGAFNDLVAQQTDLPITLWDVDTFDWKHRDPQQLLTYVRNGVKDGSIILMHDIHPSTADGLDAVMAYLQSHGYTFVTVSEMEQAQ